MKEFTKRLVVPLVPPFLALLFLGVLVFSVSRILLAVPEAGSTTLAFVLAAEILGVAAVIAAGSRVKAAQRALLIVVALGLVAGGGVAAGMGVRELHKLGLEIELVAKDLKFSSNHMAFPAHAQMTVRMVNEDNGIPHDVVVARDAALSDLITQPRPVAGPANANYKVEPLDEGEYFFFCSVHPATMKGELTVAENITEPSAEPQKSPTPVPSGSPSPTSPTQSNAPTEIDVIASNFEFNVERVTLRAGATISVHFENRDSAPHNWSVYTEEFGGTAVFKEELITAGSADWTFTSPQPGDYFFRCDAHPNMKGTVSFE